jgi:hypothetical protein
VGDATNKSYRFPEAKPAGLLLQIRAQWPIADKEQVIRPVSTMQLPESLQEEIHAVPSLEAAHETDDKPAVRLQSATKRSIVPFGAEQVRIHGVRQNFDLPVFYAGFGKVTAQGLRNGDQHVGSSPRAMLDPSSDCTKQRPATVFLFFVSKRGINF